MSRMARLLAGCLLTLPVGCGGSQQQDRPNLLIISLDTLRSDHLGCYGYGRDTSPIVDALAARGVLFENARSCSPKTGPSHMSLFTGLLPDAHGVRNLDLEGNRRLSPNIPTLARLLHDAGWRTAAFHGGGHVSAKLGFDDGFERFEGPGSVEDNVSRTLSAMADFDDEPFFIFLHTYEIHDPYIPPDEYRNRYTDPDYKGRVGYSREGLHGGGMNSWEQQHELFWMRVDRESEADRQQLIDLYDGGIAYTDHELARLFAGLHELGHDQDTIVVLLADHGEEFMEHGDYTHNDVYHELLEVPLILSLPAREVPAVPPALLAGRRIEQRVQLVDVLPTLLELLDQTVPSHVQGHSLVPLLRDRPLEPADAMANWPRNHQWALEHGTHKLIQRETALGAQGKVRRELYDLEADPGETHDLAAEQPELLDEMGRRLVALRDLCRAYQHSLEAGEAVSLDEDTRHDLQALGYLGGGN